MKIPVLTWFVNANSATWFNGYTFSFERLLLNGLFTYLGLWALSGKKSSNGTRAARRITWVTFRVGAS